MEAFVKGPVRVAGFEVVKLEKLYAINEASNPDGGPVYPVDVVRIHSRWDYAAVSDLGIVGTVVGQGVGCDVYPVWVEAYVLNNVNLTRARPLSVEIIRWQHPKGRPRASTLGQLNTTFKTTIEEISFKLAHQSARGIAAATGIFSTGGYG